jgi:hypothetical protein
MSARIALLNMLNMAAESDRTAVADRFKGFSLMGTKCGRHRLLRADVLSSPRWLGVPSPDQIERAQHFQRTSGGANGAVGEVKIAGPGFDVRVP